MNAGALIGAGFVIVLCAWGGILILDPKPGQVAPFVRLRAAVCLIFLLFLVWGLGLMATGAVVAMVP